MRAMKAVLGIVFFCLMGVSAGAVEVRFARYPAPSPDGSMIAFSWRGDLWVVSAEGGEARRLTANPAADRHPVWSRDGKLLAFSSNRFGNDDVFVMPADGSAPPRRLTFASLGDTPVDVTPDGKAVVFVSRRDESVRWMAGIYAVQVDGGTPRLVQAALGDWAAFSPNGFDLAYVRGVTKWWRRGYRGAANREIWLHTDDGSDVQVTRFEGDDDFPSWAGPHTIVFLSARSGRKNVFTINVVTGAVAQLTHHDGSDVRAPRCSADGRLVAYEFEDGLWTVPASGGEPRRLHIEAPADFIRPSIEHRKETKGAEELAVSPDGKLAAFVVHGDVFVTAIRSKKELALAKPPTVRVTATPAREKDIAWAPDGKSLIFTSDRAGNDDLYRVRPRDPKLGWLSSFEFPVTRLTKSPAEERLGRFSPGGKRIAYVRGRGDLVVMNADGTGNTVLFTHWETPEFHWSPDGRWIAYAIPDMSYNTEVWIVPSDGGTPYNVSRHPDEDVSPVWSPDGRRLVWLTKRHADTMDVWGVWLRRVDDERTPEGWLHVFESKKKAAAKAAKGAEKGAAKKQGGTATAAPQVKIEFGRLWQRARGITVLKGDEAEPLVSKDGARIFFTANPDGERDLYSIRFDGRDLKRLTKGGQAPEALQLGPKGKQIFYLDKNGRIKRVAVSGKPGDAVPFTARYDVDRDAEHRQVFDETWRALDEWFYDGHFHGVDWAAKKAVYGRWLQPGMDESDFSDLVNLMLGELNASHMGYYPGRGAHARGAHGDVTGFIGALFDPQAGGPGVQVREVLRDSPADRVDVHLKPGERIVAVGGHPVTAGTNIYALFVDTVGQRVPLRIRSLDGAERTAVVIPVSARAERQLRYKQWVSQRRKIVDKLSNGMLGYIHIQGMNIPSFEEFERDLYAAAHGKRGLIIDVRSNGGGWTTDYLMTVLNVRRHAFTVPRGGDPKVKAYPQGRLPLAAWTRPAAALCDEESYSNAEIFSHAFETLNRGPLVGMPTFGAVISTGGMTLLNGAWVRLPLRGWYVAGSGINMEHHGAVPGVIVPQPPAQDTAAASDTQLARAVAVLQRDIPNDPRRNAW
ncbi:MAG: peptidase S41 [Acidobacteria bacterium]|nr:peptidase S41 [Acidobacteriota bacterium]